MNCDVIVSIKGMQLIPDEENDSVEVISPGEYFEKNKKKYIVYEDLTPEGVAMQELTKSTIKLSDDKVEIIKKGNAHTHMIFEEGKSNMASYQTPFGNMMIGLHTHRLRRQESDKDWPFSSDTGLLSQ